MHKYAITITEEPMDYLIEETVGPQKKRAIVMVGRLNPPTRGHYKVIDAMKAYKREHPELNLDDIFIVVVNGEKSSADKTKNPLTAEERVKFLQASGKANGVKVITAPSGFAAFEEVRKAGAEPIVIAAGSDRIDRYIEILDKYFTDESGGKIKHVKIGLTRDGQEGGKKEKTGTMEKALDDLKDHGELDDSEVSGSMARRAAELGYEQEFAHIVGLENKPNLAKLMYKKIRAAIGVEDGAP